MKKDILPDPDALHPLPGFDGLIHVRPSLDDPRIEAGEFTYVSDGEFESRVTHFYDFLGDRLKIGKFCQIASGVKFVMNGANHRMNAVTTFPFYIFEGWGQSAPPLSELPLKGDTVVGNDVWIGENATVLPGVHIGDGAIIGMNSTVGSDVPPYTVAAGNPAKPIRKRFDDELIALLEEFRWWDRPTEEIRSLLPVLTDGNLEAVRAFLKKELGK